MTLSCWHSVGPVARVLCGNLQQAAAYTRHMRQLRCSTECAQHTRQTCQERNQMPGPRNSKANAGMHASIQACKKAPIIRPHRVCAKESCGEGRGSGSTLSTPLMLTQPACTTQQPGASLAHRPGPWQVGATGEGNGRLHKPMCSTYREQRLNRVLRTDSQRHPNRHTEPSKMNKETKKLPCRQCGV